MASAHKRTNAAKVPAPLNLILVKYRPAPAAPSLPMVGKPPPPTQTTNQTMTRPIQNRPCRQLSIAMDDALFELIDSVYLADDTFSSRADVARALMWTGAAVMLGIADDQHDADADALVPLRDVIPSGRA